MSTFKESSDFCIDIFVYNTRVWFKKLVSHFNISWSFWRSNKNCNLFYFGIRHWLREHLVHMIGHLHLHPIQNIIDTLILWWREYAYEIINNNFNYCLFTLKPSPLSCYNLWILFLCHFLLRLNMEIYYVIIPPVWDSKSLIFAFSIYPHSFCMLLAIPSLFFVLHYFSIHSITNLC